MPTLNIEGRKVKVADSFLKLSPEDQNRTVEEIAASLKIAAPAAADAPEVEAEKPAAPVGLNDVVRSTATGVPILGGMLNKANAAINAAVAPIVEPFLDKGPETLDQPTFGQRYKKSVELQDARDKKFAEESPIIDTVAKVAGGVGATIPLVMAAPMAMGAAGTLPQMVTRGALSGAGISAADAAVRGEDVVQGAGVGGAFGAGAPLVARGIGKIAAAVRPTPAPVQQNTVRVGNQDIPLKQSEVTGDAAQSANEQIIEKGALGERGQGVAQDWLARRGATVKAAEDEIAAGLDPTGASPGTVPQVAGQRVLNELSEQELTRFQTEQARAGRATAEAERLRLEAGGIGAIDPATGAPAIVAESPYVAGATIGAGVTRARDAARQGVRENYDAANAVPGAYDPAVPRTMAEEIRARANTGPEPLWVDPQSTGKANEALKLLDQTLNRGLFHNAAAPAPAGPVGPVAQAAAAATPAKVAPTEAEQAVAQLIAQGVNPAKARAAVADLPGGANLRPGAMEPHDVALPNGQAVRVEPRVVEASSLKTSADAGYDQTLQPRDRGRAASDVQINDIARNLNPARLGVSTEADRGAPIVGQGMVESGNGRVLAIRRAYAEGGEAAARYRAMVEAADPAAARMSEPVLVRERTTPMTPAERKAFTVSANQSSTLSMSAPERALADSRALTPESLGLIRNPADLGSAENRDFVRAFMSTVPQAERGALMTAGGDLSSEGLARVRNAVLAKAYGDTPILSRVAEATSDDIKSISNALVSAAPEWASLKGSITAGRVPAELDATEHLLDAVSRTARIRGQGVGLEASQAQADAFAQQSAESKLFQRMFYDADGARAAPAAQVSTALRNYAQEAAKVDAAPGLNLGLAPVTARDILETTARKVGAPAALSKEVTERAAAAAAPAAREAGESIPEIGVREMDNARKRLNVLRTDAIKAARAPGGSESDLRAINRIIDEFDNLVIDAHAAGRFSGDSELAQRLILEARASHSAYRQTFTARGTNDPIGRAVEKILGRYGDTAATPDEIAKLSYGAFADPGGGDAAKVALRLRSILGPTSPEWGAYKQGLVSHLIDPPADGAARTAAQTADRIDKFLTGSKGRTLANTVLSAEERAGLKSYADNLRATEPVRLADMGSVDKMIARISGRDGGTPATAGQVVDMLYAQAASKTARGPSVQLAERLKRELSPEGWTSLRQGMWAKLTEAGEGKIPMEAQALSQRLHEFLNESGSDLAKVLFNEAERAQMSTMAKVYRQMIPVKGTTNPSGTAPMLAKIANKASNNLLAMLGAASHGFPGLAVGYGVQKGLAKYADAKGANAAVRSFYGEQPRLPIRSSRVPIALTQGAVPAQNQ